MENEMFDELILSLNQALDYAKGDKTKARSVIVDLPNEETEEWHVKSMAL